VGGNGKVIMNSMAGESVPSKPAMKKYFDMMTDMDITNFEIYAGDGRWTGPFVSVELRGKDNTEENRKKVVRTFGKQKWKKGKWKKTKSGSVRIFKHINFNYSLMEWK
jgi:hypothetical protein